MLLPGRNATVLIALHKYPYLLTYLLIYLSNVARHDVNSLTNRHRSHQPSSEAGELMGSYKSNF